MSLKPVQIKKSMTDYKNILELYRSSFPEAARFPIWLLRIMSHLKGAHSVAFCDGDRLCGFSYFLVNEETVFIFYLAVNNTGRSKGYGSQIISWIRETYPDRDIFLDVEEPDECAENNSQRLKRIEFYRRNGIFETEHSFTYGGVVYRILCINRNFMEEDYYENLTSYFKLFKKKRRGLYNEKNGKQDHRH